MIFTQFTGMRVLTSIQDIEEDLKVHVENKKDFKDTNNECIELGSITAKHSINEMVRIDK